MRNYEIPNAYADQLPDNEAIFSEISRGVKNTEVVCHLFEAVEQHYYMTSRLIQTGSLRVVGHTLPFTMLEWKEDAGIVTAFFREEGNFAPSSHLTVSKRTDYRVSRTFVKWNVSKIDYLEELLEIARSQFGQWCLNPDRCVFHVQRENMDAGTPEQY